jgi:hypothetical protein
MYLFIYFGRQPANSLRQNFHLHKLSWSPEDPPYIYFYFFETEGQHSQCQNGYHRRKNTLVTEGRDKILRIERSEPACRERDLVPQLPTYCKSTAPKHVLHHHFPSSCGRRLFMLWSSFLPTLWSDSAIYIYIGVVATLVILTSACNYLELGSACNYLE